MIMTRAPPLPPRHRPVCSPIGGARILATRGPSGSPGAQLALAQFGRQLSATALSSPATRAACNGFGVSHAPGRELVSRHPLPPLCRGDRRGSRVWESTPLSAADSAAQDAKPPVRAAGSAPSPSPPLSPRMTLPAHTPTPMIFFFPRGSNVHPGKIGKLESIKLPSPLNPSPHTPCTLVRRPT